MKKAAIIQARMGSKRFPGKVLEKIAGHPMLGIVIKRCNFAKKLDQVIVATTNNEEDNVLCDYLKVNGCSYYRGDEDDVLNRYLKTAKHFNIDTIIRITADCPIVDPKLIDSMIGFFEKNQDIDYLSNRKPASYPDGLDVEIFKTTALEASSQMHLTSYDKEHVTPKLYSSNFNTENYEADIDYSEHRWTVDEKVDLELIQKIFGNFFPNLLFGWEDAMSFILENDHLQKINSHINRDEGSRMATGQKLWRRAKNIIPGGTHLFSKHPDLHAPSQWPTYFSKAKDCFVWDLDNKKFTDFYLMGVGTNLLGYSNPKVDEAVRHVLETGNLSSFSPPEEVWLAEKLLEIDPWADMVRYTRSGGEAISVALRIGRAASGKDNIAFCGYHGWHDWYLSANLRGEDKLSTHLMPELSPKGVPSALRDTSFCFRYNQIDELEHIIQNGDVGVIIMEVMRNIKPEPGFLSKVAELARKNDIVLIFDECSSGFRSNLGGLYKNFGLIPDIVIYGKTLGNGYAINAIVGKQSVMQEAKNTFISSTFWTERIGPTAALATIKELEENPPWDHIKNISNKLEENWTQLGRDHGISLETFGIDGIKSFKFHSKNALKYKTLITQEMLKLHFLAGTSVYVCSKHSNEILSQYLEALSKIFLTISECENGRNIDALLVNGESIPSFSRLN